MGKVILKFDDNKKELRLTVGDVTHIIKEFYEDKTENYYRELDDREQLKIIRMLVNNLN